MRKRKKNWEVESLLIDMNWDKMAQGGCLGIYSECGEVGALRKYEDGNI